MNYRDLDEFVAKYGTQHNSDLPYKEAVNQVIRKDFIENVRQKNVLEIRAIVESLCDKVKEIGGDTFSVRTSKDYLWIDVDDANGNRILDYDETIKITKKEEQDG